MSRSAMTDASGSKRAERCILFQIFIPV